MTFCECLEGRVGDVFLFAGYLLGIVGGDFESITADFIGGEREGLSCGRLQRYGALKGAQGD